MPACHAGDRRFETGRVRHSCQRSSLLLSPEAVALAQGPLAKRIKAPDFQSGDFKGSNPLRATNRLQSACFAGVRLVDPDGRGIHRGLALIRARHGARTLTVGTDTADGGFEALWGILGARRRGKRPPGTTARAERSGKMALERDSRRRSGILGAGSDRSRTSGLGEPPNLPNRVRPTGSNPAPGDARRHGRPGTSIPYPICNVNCNLLHESTGSRWT